MNYTTKDPTQQDASEWIARFWENTDKRGKQECWKWLGGKTKAGYGQLGIDRKTFYAHRLSYEMAHGPIPDNLYVLHRCDNPGCVNPDHLFLGTQTDNMRDASAKGRTAVAERHGSHTHPESVSHGELNVASKLTKDQVNEIRHSYETGHVLQGDLALQYGVCQQQISRIIHRLRWKHLL